MNSPWSKTEVADDKKSITFTAKKEATWEQMEAWLERSFGKDPKIEWMGFGEIGEDFSVVLVRKARSWAEAHDDSDDEEEEEEYECERCHSEFPLEEYDEYAEMCLACSGEVDDEEKGVKV